MEQASPQPETPFDAPSRDERPFFDYTAAELRHYFDEFLRETSDHEEMIEVVLSESEDGAPHVISTAADKLCHYRKDLRLLPHLLGHFLPVSFRLRVWELVLEEDRAAYLDSAAACNRGFRRTLMRAGFLLLPLVRFIQSISTLACSPFAQLLDRLWWRMR